MTSEDTPAARKASQSVDAQACFFLASFSPEFTRCSDARNRRSALEASARRWASVRNRSPLDLAAGDLDAAWARLSGEALGFLLDRAGVPAAHLGSPSATLRRNAPAPTDGCGCASTAYLQRQAAAVRASASVAH